MTHSVDACYVSVTCFTVSAVMICLTVNLFPWSCYTCPLAESYIDRAALEAGAAAEMAATRKEEKYVDLGARYIFEPIAVETLGVFDASARHLLDDLGRRISENLGEA